MEGRRTRRESAASIELEKKKRRQEIYLNAIGDLEILRDHYKNELKEKLEKKVKEQREERKRRKKLEQIAIIQQQEKLKELKDARSKLPKSDGMDDTEFLKKVPVSRNYIILRIQDDLRKKNELNMNNKIKECHKLVSNPVTFQKLEREIRNGEDVTFDKLQQLSLFNSMKKKFAMTDDSDNTGIKALSPISDENQLSSKEDQANEKKNKTERKKFRDVKNSEIEELFPSIEYPNLSTVERDMESPAPDPIETQRLHDHQRRTNQLEGRKRLLRVMFQQSIANEAATSRLIKKYQQLNFASLAEGNDVKELVTSGESANEACNDAVIERFLASKADDNTLREDTNRNIEEYLESLSDIRITDAIVLPVIHENYISRKEEDETFPPQTRTFQLSTENNTNLKNVEKKARVAEISSQEKSRHPIKLAPLTMQALEETSQVKIVGVPERLWMNPAHTE